MRTSTESTYTLRVLRGEVQPGAVNIGLASAELAPRLQNGSAVVDLDRDGELEFFHACASMEGLHLSVWSGPPAAGKRQWHRYVYLGYDLEPTCSELVSGGAGPPG